MYDFDGEKEGGELVVKEGDILTIIKKDIGDGWWEAEVGTGPNKTVGIVPESYCEVLDGDDDWDEEWDDHEQDGPADKPSSSADRKRSSSSASSRTSSPSISLRQHHTVSVTSRHAHGTLRRNINRFTPFVKSGTESFVLHTLPVERDITGGETTRIVVSDEGHLMWEPSPWPYTVEVRDPEKKSKYMGIKSFIAYSVIPSHTRTAVTRRYKHYDWLHDRLAEKFPMLSVPPLPDKQYDRRFDEAFVEKRKERLGMWTNRIVRHPVLSQCQAVNHFLTCSDGDEKEWKAGKRKVEKDDMVGGCWYLTVLPRGSGEHAEAEIERFGQFQHLMEDACARMRNKFADHSLKMSGPLTNEFNRFAGVIKGLSHCFQMDKGRYAKGLNRAIEDTSSAYFEIAEMHRTQPKRDMIPTLDRLKEYLGILQELPDFVDIHRGALNKVRNCDKMKEESKMDIVEASGIKSRADKVSAVLLAETHHFHRERVADFNDTMKFLLKEQIDFHRKIAGRLETSLAYYSESTRQK